MSQDHASTAARWAAWYAAFEACAHDDQWARLSDFLAEDAQYRVIGVPFAATVRGRAAIVAGFQRSFAQFDRKFDRRQHIVTETRFLEPGHVEVRIWGVYSKAGLPDLAFPSIGHLIFDGPRIALMIDLYDQALPQSEAALQWIATHGAALGGLDPSYA